MRSRIACLVVAVGTIALPACYMGRFTDVEDLATVTTLVDSQAPLQDARTYAMPDTVIHSTVRVGSDLIGHEADDEILASIRGHFAELGWREITEAEIAGERPDVVVLATVFEKTNTGVAYTDWWSYWGYWPGWPAYGPEWGWGMPVGAVEFTYETGTLALVMLDIRNDDEAGRQIPAIWLAAINGVVTSNAVAGTLAGIDQAFVQSPYLRRP